MKTIILAGGFGTRLSEYTDLTPKPMVRIGDKPILWHIMNYYAKYDHKDFYLALGYKGEAVKEYFLNRHAINSDFSVNLETGVINPLVPQVLNWRVNLIDTGLSTMTGGRLKRLKDYIGKDCFLLTYGDGLADINLKELLTFHKSHGKMVTISAVRPAARFGELALDGHQVMSFKEKPQTTTGWINGGYFVIEPEFFDFVAGDETVLESEPLEHVAAVGELMAYKHHGFWQCMDTKRDKDFLENLWQEGKAPWAS